MYYFYCPNCGNEREAETTPDGKVHKILSGHNVLIYHCKCEKCNDKNAGYIFERIGDNNEKKRYQEIIAFYQNLNKQGV